MELLLRVDLESKLKATQVEALSFQAQQQGKPVEALVAEVVLEKFFGGPRVPIFPMPTAPTLVDRTR